MTDVKGQSAIKIIQALVQGIDPTTGESIEQNSVVSKVEVMRAMLAAIAALSAEAARATRRATLPPNIGKTWTEKDAKTLIEDFRKGVSAAEMARKYGRTVRAIEARLEKLGMMKPEDRVTSDRFGAQP